MITFRESFQLVEEMEDSDGENFDIADIQAVLAELSPEELNEVGEFILDLIYDPSFDEEDLEENSEDLNEVKYFKTKKREINRNKKLDKVQRRKQAKERKKYYRKNKSKLKRKNKIYRKKVKRQPNIVRKHR